MRDNQRLTVDVPTELHRDFKIWCVLNGKKMNDVIREFLRETIINSGSNVNKPKLSDVSYSKMKVANRRY